MSTNPERFYYVDNNRLAIVEKNGITTVDGASTLYKSVSGITAVRINTLCKADHFNTGSNIVATDGGSTSAGPLGHIPTQFHEALVYKVIAMGYKTPPTMDLQVAQFFDAEYQGILKKAKKFARSNYIQTGMIVPQEF